MPFIVTRGMGKRQRLVTRGFGKTLFVVVGPPVTGGGPTVGPGIYEPYIGPLLPGEIQRAIQTRTIRVPLSKKPITVDVLFVEEHRKGEVLSAILENPKYPYKSIEIISIDKVEFE